MFTSLFTYIRSRSFFILIVQILAIFAIIYGAMFYFSGDELKDSAGRWGRGDHVQFNGYLMAKAQSLKHGQLPFWDPYLCGGVPYWEDSQSSVLSPVDLVALFTDLQNNMRMKFFLTFGLAGLSMFAFFRLIRVRFLPSLWGSFYFALSGSFLERMAVGHYNFFQLAWFPLALGLFVRSIEDKKSLWPRIGTALVLSIILFSGGNYILLIAAVFFVPFVIIWSLREQSWRPILTLAVIGVIAVGFSATKVLPAMTYATGDTERVKILKNEFSAVQVWSALVTKQDQDKEQLEVMINEGKPVNLLRSFGTGPTAGYIGWIPVGLLFLFLFSKKKTTLQLSLLATLPVLTMLAMSRFIYNSPLYVLQHFPIFKSWDMSMRFAVFIPMIVLMIATIYMDSIYRRAKRRLSVGLGAGIIVGLLVFGFFDLGSYARFFLYHSYTDVSPTTVESLEEQSDHEFYNTTTDEIAPDKFLSGVHGALSNKGIVDCYYPPYVNYSDGTVGFYSNGQHDTILPNTAPEYRGEYYLKDNEKGTVVQDSWTPNRVAYTVNSDKATTLILNVNYFPGWNTTIGEVVNHNKLLAVELPAGKHSLELYYRPPYFYTSLGLTVFTILGLIGYAILRSRFSLHG